MTKGRGLLVILSGPSGVGKTTVVDRLTDRPGYRRAVTATTRAPRGAERDGVDYHFLPEEEFRAGIESGRFLEHANVHGKLYGTPRAEVERVLADGDVCLLNVDVQGAAQVRDRIEPTLLVFLAPPGVEELERRLSRRGTEDPEALARRLEVAKTELARQGEYDVVVVNDVLERAVEELAALVERRREED